MNTPDVLRRIDAMERRADAMQTLARMLLSQAERQRQEMANLRAQCSTGNAERVEAPSLAAMLRTKAG